MPKTYGLEKRCSYFSNDTDSINSESVFFFLPKMLDELCKWKVIPIIPFQHFLQLFIGLE